MITPLYKVSMSANPYIERFNLINFNKIIDHPNILIAANFWDRDRFQAAKTCYQFMRAIDDLIDNHKTLKQGFSPEDRIWLETQVDQWLQAIRHKKIGSDPFQNDLIETIDHFKVPLWSLEAFAKAMYYDIDHDGFPSLQAFLDYSAGASIAPSSIFVHLCGIKSYNGGYQEPGFDVRAAAKPCAIFSYLVHIIRDFQKDQLNHLSYFADDLIDQFGLSRADLKKIAQGGTIPYGFRQLVEVYMTEAEQYRQQTLKVIHKISPLLEPSYQLSLHIIYQLYLMVYERIDVSKGNFTTEELNPTSDEIRARVLATITSFQEVRTT